MTLTLFGCSETDEQGTTDEQSVSADTLTKVIYVNGAKSTSGDGLSSENAFASLQYALSLAQAGEEIWVAAGRITQQKTEIHP